MTLRQPEAWLLPYVTAFADYEEWLDGTLVRRGRELLEQEIERFTVVEHDGVLVGCAALYPFSEDNAAELACLAVTPASGAEVTSVLTT